MASWTRPPARDCGAVRAAQAHRGYSIGAKGADFHGFRGMTPIERVRSTRRMLSAGAILQSVGWGLAAAFGLLAIISFATLLDSGLADNTGWQMSAAFLVGIAVAGTLLWRARHLASVSRVALWIEEKIPSLHYTLVTALDTSDLP